MSGSTIYINGRFLTKPVTGVQRYSLELIRQMDALLPGSPLSQAARFVCLVPPGTFRYPAWENIEIRRVGMNGGNLWEQIDLPLHARGGMLFSPANIGPCYYRNQAITFHDASVFALPRAYSPAFRAKYMFIFRRLSKDARLVLTVSRFSQQELARYLEVASERFTVVTPGCDHLDDVQPDAQVFARYGIEKNSYLLMVSGRSAHKNLGNVFQALKLLGRGTRVVVAGASSAQVFQQERVPAAPAGVEMLGYLRDEELKALYENALGLIFPSIYEGFGLPVLEAMRCGCPVLCSRAASLPEVAGDAAVYFDPYQPAQIAEKLDEFLSAPEQGQELRMRGRQRAAQFPWSATGRKMLEILFSIITSRNA